MALFDVKPDALALDKTLKGEFAPGELGVGEVRKPRDYGREQPPVEPDDWGPRPVHTLAWRDLPTQPGSGYETVQAVKSALDTLERGYFREAALLADLMFRDDRIQTVFRQRNDALLGLPVEVDAARGEDDGEPSQVAESAADALQALWPNLITKAQAAEMFRWGWLLGACPVEVIWTKGERWTPRLKVWHPQYLQWRWDTRSFWILTQEGPREITPGDGTWFLFTPYGYERAWMGGLVRCLSTLWLIRQWSMRDHGRYNEVHGLPVRAGITPMDTKKEQRDRFVRELSMISTEATILLPQRANGDGYKLELIEAKADTWESFVASITKTDEAIAIAVLGQNLTTQAGGTHGGGAFAAAKVHKDVKAEILEADAENGSEQIRKQVLYPWASYNFGGNDPNVVAPTPRWVTEPPGDLAQRGTALQALGAALPVLAKAGADTEKLLEDFEVELLPEGQRPDPELLIAPPAPAAAPGEAKPPPKKVEASAIVIPHTPALMPLVRRVRLAYAGRNKPRGWIDGQAYVDHATALARGRAAAIFSPDVKELLALVKGATSLSDLTASVEQAYRAMATPERLAELVERTLILAELAGRLSVLEDLG